MSITREPDSRRWLGESWLAHIRNRDAHHAGIERVDGVTPDQSDNVILTLEGAKASRPASAQINQKYIATDTSEVSFYTTNGWTDWFKPGPAVYQGASNATEVVNRDVSGAISVGAMGLDYTWPYPDSTVLKRFLVNVQGTLPTENVTFLLKKNGTTIPNTTVTIQGSGNGDRKVNLTFTDVPGEDGYKIDRAPNNGGVPGTWAQIGTTGVGVTNYQDGPFTPGAQAVTYWYRVKSYNAAGNSTPSTAVSAVIPATGGSQERIAILDLLNLNISLAYKDKLTTYYSGTATSGNGGLTNVEAKVVV